MIKRNYFTELQKNIDKEQHSFTTEAEGRTYLMGLLAIELANIADELSAIREMMKENKNDR